MGEREATICNYNGVKRVFETKKHGILVMRRMVERTQSKRAEQVYTCMPALLKERRRIFL